VRLVEMESIWVEIPDFPRYSISSNGEVVNNVTHRVLQQSTTPRGEPKVGLVDGGKQYTRSVKLLVAEAFVEGRNEIFDTPIHLDGNRLNNRADNLAWRPRWFAVKYSMQFTRDYHNSERGPIRDVETGEVYPSVYEVGVMNGLLFKDVFVNCLSEEPCFPTGQRFEWLH
jgi:hypothetical protein